MTDTLNRPSYLSSSQFTKFSDCGEAYRLHYLTDAPRQPQGALLGGIAVHETVETIYRNHWHLSPYDHQEAILELFAWRLDELVTGAVTDSGLPARWGGRKSKANPNGEDLAWWHENGPRMIQTAADVMLADAALGNQVWSRGDDPVAGIELSLTITTEFGVPITGKIDALMIDADGLPFVRDWTTGKPGGKTPFQGAIYAVCLREHEAFGMDVERCQYVYLKAKADDTARVFQDFDPRPFADRVMANFAMMNRAVDAGVFMMVPSTYCGGCAVKASCDWGKTLS